MVNRLYGLKVLIDSATLGEDPQEKAPQIMGWSKELFDLKEKYRAPLHFTPLDSGVTFALVWLHVAAQCQKHDDVEKEQRELDKIRRAAQRDLAASEEMYTQRRAFYQTISNLYYLYDDFNDRRVHLNHALQMAGTEWASVLSHLVKD